MTLNALPATETAIARKALILIGSAARFESLDDSGDADARDLLALWHIARPAALVLHPFNILIRRATIQRDAAVATIGPAYRYRLPADCLRWLPWSREDRYWFDAVEEGGALLTDDEGPLYIRMIADETDVTRWPPLLVDLMAYTLAMEYAQAKAQMLGLADRLSAKRDAVLAEARRIDGLSSPNRQHGPGARQSRWVGARWRSNSNDYEVCEPWRS